jgi:single-strand DNA-binding protein
MINNVILTGRLTKDADLRKTTSGKSVASFSLAVDRGRKAEGQPTADYVPCVAWDKTADLLAQYCHKGSLIGVEGKIQTRSYEDPNSRKKVYVTEVVINNLTFLESKSQQTQQTEQFNDMPVMDIEADDLPF